MDQSKNCMDLNFCAALDALPSGNHSVTSPRSYPQVIKYMGSKATLLSFISEGVSQIGLSGRPIVDLFAGACAISGGFGGVAKIISNDIQQYSSVIASSYLRKADGARYFDLIPLAEKFAIEKLACLPGELSHSVGETLEEFNFIEEKNRELIKRDFEFPYHLFTRAYSGTWWSAEQCVWIDSIRQALDLLYANGAFSEADFKIGLTCLMHAMAYTSQGTGHYAQYRDAKDESSMQDIAKYRRLSVADYFRRKFSSLVDWNDTHVIDLRHEIISKDYRDCLAEISSSVIYADPPYAFVHYSRFYHAIETVVRYDYPVLQVKGGEMVKGRYRQDRHQSPFCIGTQVRSAFVDLFDGAKSSSSDLLLSYSNTGMIDIEELIDLANQELGGRYRVRVNTLNYDHMTMGRRDSRTRQVEESLIVAKRI